MNKREILAADALKFFEKRLTDISKMEHSYDEGYTMKCLDMLRTYVREHPESDDDLTEKLAGTDIIIDHYRVLSKLDNLGFTYNKSEVDEFVNFGSFPQGIIIYKDDNLYLLCNDNVKDKYIISRLINNPYSHTMGQYKVYGNYMLRKYNKEYLVVDRPSALFDNGLLLWVGNFNTIQSRYHERFAVSDGAFIISMDSSNILSLNDMCTLFNMHEYFMKQNDGIPTIKINVCSEFEPMLKPYREKGY